MTYHIPIWILALTCLAANVSPNSPDHDQLTSSASLLNKWLDLYKQLYDATDAISLDVMKEKLLEMLAIEQTDAFKSDLKPVDEFMGYPINHRRILLAKYSNTRITNDPELTITDLLLATFDYDSNDCTIEFFQQLNDIYKTFRDASAISKGLQDNRDMQYKNCWNRFMASLVPTLMLLGKRTRSPLSKLATFVYPNVLRLVKPSANLQGPTYQVESVRIARRIVEFLKYYEIEGKYFNVEFQKLVQNPCKILIETTMQIMKQIYGMLEFSGTRKSFLLPSQLVIINRYMMCDRIMADLEFIKSIVAQTANAIDSTSRQQFEQMEEPTAQTARFRSNPQISTELTLGLNDNNAIDEPTLITQQSFEPEFLQETQNPAKRQRIETITPRIEAIPALPAIQTNNEDTNNNQVQQADPVKTATVVRVERGIGRDHLIRFPTIWSDGTITMEHQDDLAANWPDAWKEQCDHRLAVDRARFLARWSDKSKAHADRFEEDIEKKTVVSIGHGIGRGEHTVYPTTWSDGSKSDEKKEYLTAFWPNQWRQHMRAENSARQSRYAAKKRFEKATNKRSESR